MDQSKRNPGAISRPDNDPMSIVADWAGEAPAQGELVLIIEDNERNLKLARDVLRFHGYQTVEGRTAGEAIALAGEWRPDLVITDVRLPDADGTAIVDGLRSNPATAETPVVAMTAFAMRGDEQRLLAAGFDGYMAKPISIRQLATEIRTYLDRAGRPRADEVEPGD